MIKRHELKVLQHKLRLHYINKYAKGSGLRNELGNKKQISILLTIIISNIILNFQRDLVASAPAMKRA